MRIVPSPAPDRHPPGRHAPAVLDVLALTFILPTHVLLSEVRTFA